MQTDMNTIGKPFKQADTIAHVKTWCMWQSNEFMKCMEFRQITRNYSLTQTPLIWIKNYGLTLSETSSILSTVCFLFTKVSYISPKWNISFYTSDIYIRILSPVPLLGKNSPSKMCILTSSERSGRLRIFLFR